MAPAAVYTASGQVENEPPHVRFPPYAAWLADLTMSSTDQQLDDALVARLLSVMEVTKELAGERSFDRLLDLIINRACQALGCQRSSLFLYDQDQNELYTRRVTELELEEIRLPADRGIVGAALKKGSLLFVDDPYAHDQFDPSFDKATGFKTQNILCVPLISWTDGRILGVLQLLNKLDGQCGKLDEELLTAFAAHAAIAIERAILAEQYEEKTRWELELNAARDIQSDFFPHTLPQPPGYELVAFHQAADATGGDYYDAIELDSGQLGLVVADVSGHGLGPSLLMATMRATLRGILLRETRPDVVMSQLGLTIGGDLCPDSPERPSRRFRFITVLFGTLDPAKHMFQFADAGHGPLTLHLRAADGAIRELADESARRGAPLGIHQGPYQLCDPLKLDPGDLLVLGTDGVVETRRGRELFGMERFGDLLKQHHRDPLPGLLEKLVSAATEFHEGPASDDVTLMILRRRK